MASVEEAVHPQAVRAVHDLDAAAPPTAPCGSRSVCTRTATSPVRTDSTTLSESAISAARRPRPVRSAVRARHPAAPVHPQGERTRKRRTGDPSGRRDLPCPGQVAAQLDTDEFRLYELIWQRTVSQMADAKGHHDEPADLGHRGVRGDRDVRRVGAPSPSPASCWPTSRRSTSRPAWPGRRRRVPACNLVQRRGLTAADLTADSHSTNPPARFTGASLVKVLEKLGIDRPSTYASTIGTIQDRGCNGQKRQCAGPRHGWRSPWSELLEGYFHSLVDYDFTASLRTISTRSPLATRTAPTGSPSSISP